MEIRLLGAFEVREGGRAISLSSRRLRALLATLALSAGRTVSVGVLAECVWGPELPARVAGSLSTYVVRLRKTLGEGLITTHPNAYRLEADAAQVDALRFMDLVDSARRAASAEEERAALVKALELWRGPPLDGVESEMLERGERPRLVERHLSALERRIDLDLAGGAHAHLVAELRDLTARHPLREPLWARLITALSGSGRRAEALESYETCRKRLAEELGVDPGAELQRMYRELLTAGAGETEPAASTLTLTRAQAGRRATPATEVRSRRRPDAPSTVADRLRQNRRRRFVGRSGEIGLFRRALEAPGESFTVLFVHGPGGVGKSTLLGELAEIARRARAVPVRIDAQTVQPSPSALEAALDRADDESRTDSPTGGRRVILLDAYEILTPIDDWVRERLLPRFPDDTLIVIAGRNPPSPGWTSDPGWRELLRVLPLGNLPPDDVREYLRIEAVREALHEQVLTLTHGHPLALSLLVDAIRKNADQKVPQALTNAPDIVRTLLDSIVDEAPSPRHREALEVCAHARFTTEELLHAALGGDDSRELFGWLRTLSFVEEGPYGLSPHNMTRDLLDADLRWRHWESYADLHRRVRGHLVERIRQADGVDHRLADELWFMNRTHAITSAHWEPSIMDQAYEDVLRPADIEPIIAMTHRLQGAEQAAFAAHWIERQPQAFHVFHATGGERVGYAAYLALHAASEADLATDPGTRAMWEYVLSHGPVRDGEEVMAWRFIVDTEAHRRPSRSHTLMLLRWIHEIITHTHCAWDLGSIHIDYDRSYYDLLARHNDFQLAPKAGYEIGGRRYDVYARDWRCLGTDEWLELTTERELHGLKGVKTQP